MVVIPLIRKTCTGLCILLSVFATMACKADLWRTGYDPGYAYMPASEIDFSALTHVIHFSLLPNDDGSLNATENVITAEGTTSLVTAAHNANVKVLICVGGGGSYFPNAASPAHLANFILNLTNFMATGNYDGIDVDWEPLDDANASVYTNFIIGLRAALDGFSTHKLMSTALPTGADPSLIAEVQTNFDQINVMTYDYSGPWAGWVTWFNSPLYDGGYTFPSNPSELVPSTDATVTNFLSAGIPASKLAIGLAFYADIWYGGNNGSGNGMSYPRESWQEAPTNFYQVTYNQMVSSNFPAADYNYDTVAQAAWVGISGKGTNNMFISYDSARACEAKVSYARNHSLGGVFVWEISQDHISGQPDPLLEAMKEAVAEPSIVTPQISGHNVNFGFTAMPLGTYSVEWSSDLTMPWNTLLVTNVGLTSTGGIIQVSDPLSQATRFYRVKTPQ
jgi:chitinase